MTGVFIIIGLLLAQTVKEFAQTIRKRYHSLSFSQKKEYAKAMRK
jgi:hypothetical protein